MACDAATLKTSACSNGFMQIAQVEWLARAVELQLLCSISTGGGATQVFAANYGGGSPGTTPTADAAVAIDTSTGTVWYWYGSAWH